MMVGIVAAGRGFQPQAQTALSFFAQKHFKNI
jgi:hypothetical protein